MVGKDSVAQQGDRSIGLVGGKPAVNLVEVRDGVGHDLVVVVRERVSPQIEGDDRTPHLFSVNPSLPVTPSGQSDGGVTVFVPAYDYRLIGSHSNKLTGRPLSWPPAVTQSRRWTTGWHRPPLRSSMLSCRSSPCEESGSRECSGAYSLGPYWGIEPPRHR